jgi:glycosyltransferase involved in cell wall biosynthesis
MKDNKEKILVLFEGNWLAYSPTVIQLYEELSKKYKVFIFAQQSTGQQAGLDNVYYFKYRPGADRLWYKGLFILLSFFNPVLKNFRSGNNNYQDYFFRYLFIKKLLKKNHYKKIICVDIKNLLYCSLLKKHCDFLSLEICMNENLLPLINTGFINRVIIQRQDRYTYLFKDLKLPVFWVQNAPVYREVNTGKIRKSLIFTGTVTKGFGFFYYLDYLKKYGDETLVVLGGISYNLNEDLYTQYADLLESKRLIIEKKYLDNDGLVDFIAGFEIGFCLYNFDTDWIKNYNFLTAPSGKVFKYLAAGVPVICNDIPGFDFVRSFQCGELLTDMSPDSIRKVVLKIRADYPSYVDRSKQAAKHFSFDKAIQPYVDYIESSD